MSESVGKLLQELCKLQGLSVEKLALKAGIAPSTLYRWQSGKVQPQIHQLLIVLTALKAPQSLRLRAVALLDVPRGIRAASDTSAQNYVLDGSMPGTGDLLRALRIRRGWTAIQLAAELQIAPERVSRWETSQIPAPLERLQELFSLLAALPEEQSAIIKYRVILPLSETLTSLDECEQHLDILRVQSYGCASFLGDLNFLSLEAHLWPLAQQNPTALRLLVLTWLTHAQWLLGQGRMPEMKRLADRALDTAQYQLPKEWYSVWATNLQARFLVHQPKQRDYKQALRLLSPMKAFPALSHQDHALFRELAEFAGYAGHPEHALSLLAHSRKCAVARNDAASSSSR